MGLLVVTTISKMRKALFLVFDKQRGALIYALRTAAFAWLTSFGFYLLLTWLTQTPADPPKLRPSSIRLLVAVIAAPLFENFLLVILIEFTKLFEFKHARLAAILIISLLAGLVHETQGIGHGLAGALLFGTMTYTYFAWSECSGQRRYLLTVLQHVLFNLPAAAILLSGWAQ